MSDDDPQDNPALGGRDLLTLGGLLVGCVVAGVAIGQFVDIWLATSPVFVLLGITLGIVAAGVGFWFRVRAFLGS